MLTLYQHSLLIVFVVLMLLIPAARSGRGFGFAVAASLIVALLLFQPSIGTSLRDAVSLAATGTVLVG